MTLPAHPLHIAQGESAGGCLRALLASGRLSGTVTIVRDDLSHGPLTDRGEFWKSSYRGYLPPEEVPDEIPNPWEAVSEAVATGPEGIVVWMGANPADHVVLAALCDQLAESDIPLWRVDVSQWTEGRGPHYVAEYEPEALAPAWPAAVEPVSAAARDSWRATYREVAATGDTVRRVDDGVLHAVPPDHYDDALLAVCPPEWTLAGRVVGAAMAQCDDANKVSDVFFTRRLQHLIDTGAIEIDGPRESLRTYRVRRP